MLDFQTHSQQLLCLPSLSLNSLMSCLRRPRQKLLVSPLTILKMILRHPNLAISNTTSIYLHFVSIRAQMDIGLA